MRLIGLAVVLVISLTLAPLAVGAQQSTTLTRIAFLGAESPSTNQHFLDAFRNGLREYGYVEGQNIALEARWAEGHNERFPELVRDLVRLRPAVIMAVSSPGALAAKTEAATTPTVFIAGDPIGSGLVRSLGRPEGNLTGISLFLGDEFYAKWLEVLREVIPKLSRVAVLVNPTNPAAPGYITGLEKAAQTLGVKLQPREVRDPAQFPGAFAAFSAARAQALIVVPDPVTVRNRRRIVELAAQNRIPSVYGFREFVDAGGFISYGVNIPRLCHRAAYFVDKILKGAKPADLPVEQSTKFELVINMKTAKALGLKIPQSLFVRADEIIE